ncbi:tol-pal system-associated acyl-CoA thioesterase [Arsenicitalea aurantiaca]|uniref:Tol-pal system-associated acyl-CoA thioesterase n=1 Tax=Arsenicitalea aurantiaca TaxID=1783274 RepID=A0A433XKP7_9HYPH|nr:tol-pal system-associated acyl-CoA thioesterase [Arsenicitalea aurantiaca]RUT34657.1 tol-pal system-associated acyl-CoA thioesterase [Arsenicitalea aurantiaca]
MSEEHRFPVRVYFEDTDFSGNVYHAAYLKFCERGRTEWLRSLGMHHSELLKTGIVFAVRAMTIDFLAPARIDDRLEIATRLETLGGARIGLIQEVRREDAVLTQASVTVVAMRMGDGRPVRIPEVLRSRLG